MPELLVLVAGEVVVSLLMGLAALCVFLWAALAGELTDVEPVKYQVLRSEGIRHDGTR